MLEDILSPMMSPVVGISLPGTNSLGIKLMINRLVSEEKKGLKNQLKV